MKQFYKFAALACMILCFTHASAQTETVLFTETFDTQESMEKFQTLDVDGDEESWTYNTVNECAQAMVPGFSAVNDWLITPAFDAKKGNTYLLQFRTEGSYGGVLEVAYGDQPTDECLSGNILIDKTTLDGNTWQQMETQFVCEADGPHYFAFHSVGAEWLSTLHVDDIVITEIATAPAEPENTLYGTIAYSDDAAAVMGIYSFNPQEEIELTPVATRTDYIANGGGVYVDGPSYFTCYMPYGSTVVCAYNIYDMELGTATSTINEGYQYVASDMAYDPTTGNVYCCSIDEIADGDVKWNEGISKFYDNFHPNVENVSQLRLEHKVGERLLGTDPKTGLPVSVKIGRFGPLVQIGSADGDSKPQFASLQKDQSVSTITLDEALKLFELPRTLGEFEGKEVSVGVGRFGPYVKHDGKYVSIPKEFSPQQITLEQAITLIEEKRESEAKKVVKSFPEDPELEILNGRYGVYIRYKKQNYKIPKGTDTASLSYEECKAIVADEANAPKKRATARRGSVKK